MDDWLTLLRDDVRVTGSRSATARRVGLSRATVSLLLDGKYPARPDRAAARIRAALAGRITCPHDQRDIPRGVCADRAAAPMPMSSPADLRAWSACRTCPHSKIGGANHAPE